MTRPSICYAAPGHALVSTAGTTRNVLAVARELCRWADVTVAFRSVVDDVADAPFGVVAIDRGTASWDRGDDVAMVGLDPRPHLAYLAALRRFARRAAGEFDILLEKGWRLSGLLGCQVRRRGLPAVLVENDQRDWQGPIASPRMFARFAAHHAARAVSARCTRSLPRVISESPELSAALVELRGVAPERISEIELGVDHALFHPRAQAEARAELGIAPNRTVLAYVGGLDPYHDLGPVLDALSSESLDEVELHVAGDGTSRQQYEQVARNLPVVFHGALPHDRVPTLVAAADLCLAPYATKALAGGKLLFSTLKVPEYMACARPVATVPSGRLSRLVKDQVSGFTLPNERSAWCDLLRRLPARSELAEMGLRAAERVREVSWRATAEQYLEVCSPLLASQDRSFGEQALGVDR